MDKTPLTCMRVILLYWLELIFRILVRIYSRTMKWMSALFKRKQKRFVEWDVDINASHRFEEDFEELV